MAKNKSIVKKIFSIIGTVITCLILVATVYLVINIFVSLAKNKPVKVFGYSFAVVVSESMEPQIMKGDLIVFKEIDISSVKVGDYIVFTGGPHFGQASGKSVVHSVYAIDIDDDGEIVITTKGVNEQTNKNPDEDKVTKDNLLGICTYYSTTWGQIVTFISQWGVLIVIAIIFVPFIIKQVVKIVKLSKGGDDKTHPTGGGDLPESGGSIDVDDGERTKLLTDDNQTTMSAGDNASNLVDGESMAGNDEDNFESENKPEDFDKEKGDTDEEK